MNILCGVATIILPIIIGLIKTTIRIRKGNEFRLGYFLKVVFLSWMVTTFTLAVLLMLSEIIVTSKLRNAYTKEVVEKSYELVSFNSDESEYSELKGSMFLLSGSIYGKSGTIEEYRYWYRRSDGGILPGRITSEEVTIVVYETDEVSPRYEIYTGRKELPDEFPNREVYEFFNFCSVEEDVIEYRFYVPVGTFVKAGMYSLE